MHFKAWLTQEALEDMRTLALFCEREIFGRKVAKQYKAALADAMPPNKMKHSARVARHVHSLFAQGQPTRLSQHQWTAVQAAIFHDYLERGGDHVVLQRLGLSPQAIAAVNNLTADKDGTDPLEHLQAVLPALDEDLRNIVILVKLSDRIDNLQSRSDSGSLGRRYIERSTALVNWLFRQYTGDPEYLFILRKRLRALGVKARKKYIARTFPQPTGEFRKAL